MSETDVKNALEQMWRQGFERGFQAGRSGDTGDRLPDVRFEWRGRTPVIHISRPKISLRSGLWRPGKS
jgi:hypothetical protein